jgi:hypothetical protein
MSQQSVDGRTRESESMVKRDARSCHVHPVGRVRSPHGSLHTLETMLSIGFNRECCN